MNNAVYFHQGCPVCGRTVRIGVQLLGRRVYCQHCGGGFRACDASLGQACRDAEERPQSAIVDELLERASLMLQGQPGSRFGQADGFGGARSPRPASSDSRCQ